MVATLLARDFARRHPRQRKVHPRGLKCDGLPYDSAALSDKALQLSFRPRTSSNFCAEARDKNLRRGEAEWEEDGGSDGKCEEGEEAPGRKGGEGQHIEGGSDAESTVWV